jgi:hypothetical protein
MGKKQTLQIYTNDGKILETEVTDYDAKELATKLSDGSSQYVVVGEIILAKHSLQRIMPVKAESNSASK